MCDVYWELLLISNFVFLQLAEQFGGLPEETETLPPRTGTPRRLSKGLRRKTPRKTPRKSRVSETTAAPAATPAPRHEDVQSTSAAREGGGDDSGRTSLTVLGAMSHQAYSLREMQDRLDEMIEGTLKASGPGSQKRLAFNHFIGKCLPSISDETLDDFIGHVTSYTHQCMELSSNSASHQAQKTPNLLHDQQMGWDSSVRCEEERATSHAVPSLGFGLPSLGVSDSDYESVTTL